MWTWLQTVLWVLIILVSLIIFYLIAVLFYRDRIHRLEDGIQEYVKGSIKPLPVTGSLGPQGPAEKRCRPSVSAAGLGLVCDKTTGIWLYNSGKIPCTAEALDLSRDSKPFCDFTDKTWTYDTKKCQGNPPNAGMVCGMTGIWMNPLTPSKDELNTELAFIQGFSGSDQIPDSDMPWTPSVGIVKAVQSLKAAIAPVLAPLA